MKISDKHRFPAVMVIILVAYSCKNSPDTKVNGASEAEGIEMKENVHQDSVELLASLEAREDSIELAIARENQAAFENRFYASFETDPVNSAVDEDAADDPAIWINKDNESASLVIGTNKQNGLFVYGLDGKQRQFVELGRVNNVDLRESFDYWGMDMVLVATSNRTINATTLLVLNPETGELSDSIINIPSGVDEVYGICCYRDPADKQFYVFVNGKGGQIEQWHIMGGEQIVAEMVRSFSVNSQPEGMVADDEEGILYVGVEQEGIYMLDARAGASTEMTFIDGSSEDNEAIRYDIEGLAIFEYGAQKYLLASSQGNFSYAVFRLDGKPAYLTSLIIADGIVDGVEETDGLDITTAFLPGNFNDGFLVVQDGFNTDGEANKAQNFKYVSGTPLKKLLAELENANSRAELLGNTHSGND